MGDAHRANDTKLQECIEPQASARYDVQPKASGAARYAIIPCASVVERISRLGGPAVIGNKPRKLSRPLDG
jgi:hypothetical protein